MNVDELLKSVIKERRPELTEDQIDGIYKGVRHWFDVTVDESIDAAIDSME